MCHIVKHTRMKYKLKQSYWKKKILAYKPKRRLSQKMKHKLKKWRGNNKNALCWSFYCVNDNKTIDNKCHQLMRCFFCYPKPTKPCTI